MLPKSQLKLITSLAQKKYRKEHGLFIAEGFKTVTELMESRLKLQHLYISNPVHASLNKNHTLISEKDLKKISQLKTPAEILGIYHIPGSRPIETNALVIALDDVRDPGNLGTIIRLCDWFGVRDLVCSHNTVDCYNPKVVQATMGSLSRVNISYVNLSEFLQKNEDTSIIGTFMDGRNIYKEMLPTKGVLIMGNEANGIRDEIANLVDNKITIPRFGEKNVTESLNVATATAIILSEFRRTSIEM